MRELTLPELRALPFSEEETESWHPVAHSTVANILHKAIERRQWRVSAENYCVYHANDSLCYGILHTNYRIGGDCAISFLFRNSNDQAHAFRLHACARPLRSHNLLLHGEFLQFARRYTQRFDIEKEINNLVDLSEVHQNKIEKTVIYLKGQNAVGAMTHRTFFEIFRQKFLPIGLYHTTINALADTFKAYGHNAWALYQAFATGAERLAGDSKYRAYTKLGEMFTLYDI